MIARHSTLRFLFIAAASVVVGSSLVLPSDCYATPAPGAVVVPSQQPFIGVLNDDNVYVRSGPSEVYYATVKLSKGWKVTVVGTKGDWLKILPPEGSFSYVAKAYVQKRGDGTVGRVTKADLNVRAGSALNGLKTTVQTSLQQNDDVKIVGEQDEYFKIAPPEGAYLYVKKTLVDIASQEAPAIPAVAPEKIHDPIASDPIPAGGIVAPDAVAPTTKPSDVAVVPPSASPAVPARGDLHGDRTADHTADHTVVVPATQPVSQATPATQPAEPTAEARFDTAEAAFAEASNQPIDKQPVDFLLKKYKALDSDETLPISMRRITEMRIATLKLRADVRNQYVAALKADADAKARQKALKVEQEELAQRVKDQEVTMYTAVGTLRTSSLQQSGTTMYRLTDPGTGRTLVYIRSNDSKYAGMLNQFIGVKGDINEDTNLSLKVIVPTEAEQVDQSKLNSTVGATLMPPSLLSKAATVSIGGN